MPAKTGASHAVASIVTFVVASMLSGYVSSFAMPITKASAQAALTVANVVGVSIPPEVGGVLLFVAAGSFAWGVAYHYARHGSGE